MLFIHNTRLILADKIVRNAWLLVTDGKIKGYGTGKKVPKAEAKVIDARDNYLSPGFIDLHIHGDIEKISKRQAKSGTTAFLHCLHAGKIENYAKNIEKSKQAELCGAQCLGFYLEGPFLNKDMAGAQPKRFIVKPEQKKIQKLIRAAGKDIKIMTLACEFGNIEKILKLLRKNEIVTALGHTNASFEQAEKAIDSGAHYTTHIFNRMGSISARYPGIIVKLLLDERVTAEVIADGKHVHPALLKLLIKVKGPDKIVLVSDSIAAMPPGSHKMKLKDKVYWLNNSTISGSTLTLLTAVRNMIDFTGMDIASAVRMATLNPARIAGIERQKGSIGAGKDADIVIFDKNFKVRLTVIKGKIINL
ncbi:MAG: N-acetylglucosamine-6-phosphate deacetylase [Candidatus Omnitrophota bacterium]